MITSSLQPRWDLRIYTLRRPQSSLTHSLVISSDTLCILSSTEVES